MRSELAFLLQSIVSSGVVALSDAPYTDLMPELVTLVPNVLVLQTLRDADAWAAQRIREHGGDPICKKSAIRHASSYFNSWECLKGAKYPAEALDTQERVLRTDFQHAGGQGEVTDAIKLVNADADESGSQPHAKAFAYASGIMSRKFAAHNAYVADLVPPKQLRQFCVWDDLAPESLARVLVDAGLVWPLQSVIIPWAVQDSTAAVPDLKQHHPQLASHRGAPHHRPTQQQWSATASPQPTSHRATTTHAQPRHAQKRPSPTYGHTHNTSPSPHTPPHSAPLATTDNDTEGAHPSSGSETMINGNFSILGIPIARIMAHKARVFCFSVISSTAELELLKLHRERRTWSGCDRHSSYSNLSIEDLDVHGVIAGSVETDNGGNGHPNTALNTPIFIQVWRELFRLDIFNQYDWIVKLDLDTGFNSYRLRRVLMDHPQTTPMVLGNHYSRCNSLAGAIEVFSSKAVQLFASSVNLCEHGIDFSGMAEDTWVKLCMEKLGVSFVAEPRLVTLGICGSFDVTPDPMWTVAVHPCKGTSKMRSCLDALQDPPLKEPRVRIRSDCMPVRCAGL
jgi:hypothetical protein